MAEPLAANVSVGLELKRDLETGRLKVIFLDGTVVPTGRFYHLDGRYSSTFRESEQRLLGL
jgi:hypothetical protein